MNRYGHDYFTKRQRIIRRLLSVVSFIMFLIGITIFVYIASLAFTYVSDPKKIGNYLGEIQKGIKEGESKL